jgi:hypothetical protein
MTDIELINRVDELIDDFCKNGNKSRLWTMHIPAKPDKDPDLVFSTLLERFIEVLEENETLKQQIEKIEG